MEHFYLHVNAVLLYAKWALEGVRLPPLEFLFVLAAISSVWSGLTQRPFQKRSWRPHHWLVLTHCLFFVAAISVGVRWPNDTGNPSAANQAGVFWLGAVVYGSLASCIFWIWQMKGFRWFAASLVTLIEAVTLGAILVAAMSIYGDWL